MSDFADRFIRDHTEYFARNKKVIESNNWNDTKTYNNTLDNFAQQVLSISNSNLEDKEKQLKELRAQIRVFTDTSKKTKDALFKQENQLTSSILGRLSAFIKDSKGDRDDPKAQKFILETAEIIQIHLTKCREYLDYNLEVITQDTKTEEEADYKSSEIVFQDTVFNKKIEIQGTLEDLNINDNTENLKIRFYKEDKAPLIMREPLCLLNEDIERKTLNLNTNWDIVTSTDMYINMKPENIPKWNRNKHYFDQDPVVLQFWSEEYNKIQNGITIGGYFMHPWAYFHLNFFRTPIPQPDGKEPNVPPPFRDNEWFFAENLKKCISKDYPDYYSKALLIYGTRRFGKSVILASLAHWRTITKFNSFGSIIGGTSSDINALTSKIKTSMTYIDKPFRMDIIKQNWENGETTFGIKEDASNAIIYSTLMVQNLEEGTAKKTQKTAGLAPSVSIYDEIGKYSFLKPYLAALPSFKTPYGFKCITALAGTGGEADLSKDAMDVLSNPEAYDLLPMDWDLLENKIDPDEITWKRRPFATFFPGQMAYEEGFIKNRINFSDFIDSNHEDLKDIKIDVTNWKGNKEYLVNKAAEGDNVRGANAALLKQQRKVQYPLDPEDCFLSANKNPFEYEDARRHKEFLDNSGQWDRRRRLFKDSQGKIQAEISTMPLIEYPFSGGVAEAPFLIFEDIPDEIPQMYTYVAGMDDYKQVSSNTDSVGTLYIFKYDLFGDKFAKKLVASYSGRPDKHLTFHNNCLLLLEAYNAICFMENEDTAFIEFLESKHLEDKYLAKAVDFTSSLNITNNSPRKFGWSPKQSKSKLLNMFVNYCNQDIPSINEKGEEITVKGITRINDVVLLTEIINFKEIGNYDRITACLGAIGWLHYLETNWIHPKTINKQLKEDENRKPFIKTPIRGGRGGRTRL